MLSRTRRVSPGMTAAQSALVLASASPRRLDLLRQIGDLAPDRRTAEVARVAADRMWRGVVAAAPVED